MKNKWLSIMIGMIMLVGCVKQDTENMVSISKIDITELNAQRKVSKNVIDFEDDQQGKYDLLKLMINSVDYYNLVSGKMCVTSSYLDNQTQIKYEFQINIPEYRSFVYQISSSGYSEQVMFRDSKNMYFFTGNREDLDNFSFEELINKKEISIEEIDKDDNLFKFAKWSLEERFNDINISRVANDLYGDVTMLEKAKKLTINPRCQAAIARLEEVYEVLKLYGYEKYVSFDLGMVNHFDYYTGIIFRGYTYGTGDAIGKGGRYDNLLAQFGKEASASGFTILIDDVLSALSRQNISISLKEYAYSLLLYKSEDRQNAIPLVVKLRDAGVRTELVSMTEGKTLEEYLAFGKNQGAEGILYLDGENVTVYDMASGDQETKTLQEFREEY